MRLTDIFIKRCPQTGRIVGLQKPKGFYKILFFVAGFLSLIWFLIRVIPKPSRASYPCMKATMPMAYSFVAYLVALAGSFFFYRKAYEKLRERRFRFAFTILLVAGLFSSWAIVHNAGRTDATISSGVTDKFDDPLGPNAPIGEPKGIYPGRVVWVYDKDATNENCTNSSHADAYWQETNTIQTVVDEMFSKGIQSMTGKETDTAAWDAIFRYFNINHGKGDTGYIDTETIFIKINAVTAWNGAEPDGEMPAGLGIEFDTSPQSIMSMLRQLVNVAGVPQDKIYIGDPMCDIYNNLYDKFYAEFPDIHYVSQGNVTGRYKLTADATADIIYSDKGTVMTEVTSHYFFNEMVDADYLLNIPSLKGHRWAGITLFAKNHFGSNTADHSWELHKGLMKPDDDPLRSGYNLYRVQVDLMADSTLGGNTLLYYMDALWSTSYEHQKPQKFQKAPWNNDWCSSLIFSLDPVAIESVGLDIMQKEFTEEDLLATPPRYTYVQWDGVDDYLHQAASSDWWPENITYDPDETGSPIGSLGVHEHWNNVNDMQYTRDLETGDGIELIKIVDPPVDLTTEYVTRNMTIFPNPCSTEATIRFEVSCKANLILEVYSTSGALIMSRNLDNLPSGQQDVSLNLTDWTRGVYFCVLKAKNHPELTITKKLYVN